MPSLLGVVAVGLYFAVFLAVEKQWLILTLVAAGAIAVIVAARAGWIDAIKQSYRHNEAAADASAIAMAIALIALFVGNHFVLLLIATVFIYIIASLGLNVQFGYAGMLNFAGAAMLGIGAYTAALLSNYAWFPSLLMVPAGGVIAAAIGSILLPPMLRTHGHYSAVVTIAFGLLLMTFLEVYSGFGGPQGLAVRSASIFGWSLNDNLQIGATAIAFYVNYAALALALAILVALFVRRMERSWIGLNFDAVRLDETASKCFGINIALWKTAAFTAGNFIAGMAGAFYALMLGYIAPSNFTFGDSLILVTIILLGGLGSIWGVILTAVIIIILPEKLQAIQEYRILLYAIVVTIAILFQPDGLIPRTRRKYFPGLRL
jgi:ABC-type branched-subunit amino acid transport system permease subunit